MEYTQADRDRMIRIEDKLDAVIEDQLEIKHDLYGNGRPGLIVEHSELKTQVAERTSSPTKVASVASALTALLTVATAALARHFGV